MVARTPRLATAVVLVAFGGCDARFELIDDSLAGSAGAGNDAGVVLDQGPPDPQDGGILDGGIVDGGSDASVDAGPGESDAGMPTGASAFAGSFEGRAGYSASGSVTLEDLGGGRVRISLSEDFSTARVPGPVLIVTDRTEIGRSLDRSRDIIVHRFQASELVGASTFEVEVELPEAPTVFTYCEPFTVETGRALLAEVTP